MAAFMRLKCPNYIAVRFFPWKYLCAWPYAAGELTCARCGQLLPPRVKP